MAKETIDYNNYPQISDGICSAKESEAFPICKATGDICVNGKVIITVSGANFWKNKPKHMACAPCLNCPMTPESSRSTRVIVTRTITTTTETIVKLTKS